MATNGGGSGSSSRAEEADAAFKPPPDELKFITPYLQRAHETRKADPALSYWCNFYAAQLGMTRLSSLTPQAKAFLINLMDVLETQKNDLAGNEIVHGGDLVARAHIENVALKVFSGADNEDRAGKASKATARRFLVACNFIDVLTVFAPLEQDMVERQKYAKWKAADIGKALREGRKPTPGPAGGIDEEAASDPTVTGLDAASAHMGNLHMDSVGALPTTEELDAEMAKLAAQEGGADTGAMAITSDAETFSDVAEQRRESSESPTRTRRAESRLSIDGHPGLDGLLDARNSGSQTGLNAGSPNFSMPLRVSRQGSYTSDEGGRPDTQSAFYHYTQNRIASGGDHGSGASSPHARPLPNPPGPTSWRGEGTISHLGQGDLASVHASTDQHHGTSQIFDQATVNHSALPSAPFPSTRTASQPSAIPSAPPAVPQSDLPTSLDVQQTSRVQKLARWTVSALDYEDLDTARLHLREALDICEGRITTTTKKR